MSEQLVNDQQPMILNGLAEGSIGPEPRGIDPSKVSALVEALEHGDELFAETDGIAPRKCVDGRSRLDGVNSLGPDAAGGVESLVVADALTSNQYRAPGDTASSHTKNVMIFWLDKGQKVGGHDADAAHGGSGCGACDKLDKALAYISNRGGDVRNVLKGFGVEVDDATHESIMANAATLLANGYADGGPTIIAAMRETAGSDAVETLTGEHQEVAVVLNMKVGTTLDRGAVRAACGKDGLQAFNVDVWALQQSAQAMYPNDPAKAHAAFYAALCYNVAVAAVLSDKSLRIAVHQ